MVIQIGFHSGNGQVTTIVVSGMDNSIITDNVYATFGADYNCTMTRDQLMCCITRITRIVISLV